jgi:predicted RNase H-like HicB family nuclease
LRRPHACLSCASWSQRNCPQSHGCIADIPDLPHSVAFGETPEQASAEVLRAKAAWIEAARDEGKPIPAASFRPVIYQASEVPA